MKSGGLQRNATPRELKAWLQRQTEPLHDIYDTGGNSSCSSSSSFDSAGDEARRRVDARSGSLESLESKNLTPVVTIPTIMITKCPQCSAERPPRAHHCKVSPLQWILSDKDIELFICLSSFFLSFYLRIFIVSVSCSIV